MDYLTVSIFLPPELLQVIRQNDSYFMAYTIGSNLKFAIRLSIGFITRLMCLQCQLG